MADEIENRVDSGQTAPFGSECALSVLTTLKCLSIGTPKNNKISICSKSKIDYLWLSLNLGTLQPNYNAQILEHLKPLIFHLGQMEN